MKKKAVKNKSFSKSAFSNSPLSGWIGIIVYSLILLSVYTFVYSDILKRGNLELKDKLDNEVTIKYDEMRTLLDSIPQLDEDVKKLTSDLEQYFDTYYGDVPQEKYIYLLKNLRDKSEISFKSVGFNEEVYLAGSDSSDGIEIENTDSRLQLDEGLSKQVQQLSGAEVAEGLDASSINVGMDIVKTTVDLNLKTSFKKFMKFYYEIEQHKPNITIQSLNITKASTAEDLLGYADLIDFSQLTKIEGRNQFSDSDGKLITDPAKLEQLKKAHDMVNVNIVISFYKVPSISKYITKEELYSLDLKASLINPFTYYDFFSQAINKEIIFGFDIDNYKKIFSNVSTEDQGSFSITKQVEDNISYAQVDFSFGKDTNNPRILIDFLDSNITINEPIDKIGLNVYNEFPNNNMLYVVLRDANGSDKVLQVSDGSAFIGEASLSASVPKTFAYPLKLRGVYVVQNGVAGKLDKGSYKFRSIYKGTIAKESQEPQTPEEPQVIGD